MKKIIMLVSLSAFLYTPVGYTKSKDSILQSIIIGFAKGALIEASKHFGEESAKFYFSNDQNSDSIENLLTDTIYAWDSAINKRDVNALFNLYGYEVLYYGSKFTDEKCIKDKKRFYKKHPLFSQTINNITYSRISENLYKVSFKKNVKYSDSKPTKKYPSYLVISTTSTPPSILVEGDKVTDRNLLRRYKNKNY